MTDRWGTLALAIWCAAVLVFLLGEDKVADLLVGNLIVLGFIASVAQSLTQV